MGREKPVQGIDKAKTKGTNDLIMFMFTRLTIVIVYSACGCSCYQINYDLRIKYSALSFHGCRGYEYLFTLSSQVNSYLLTLLISPFVS